MGPESGKQARETKTLEDDSRLQLCQSPGPPELTARRKAGLTGNLNAEFSATKVWPSDPPSPHCWGLEVTEKLPQG